METFVVIKDGATTSQTLQDPEKCYIRTQAFIVYKKNEIQEFNKRLQILLGDIGNLAKF